MKIKNLITKKTDSSTSSNLKNNEAIDKHIITLLKPDAPSIEPYRILKAQILNYAKSEKKRIFLITSAIRGEGKTLTAINLALSLVNGIQEDVFLIDADLRKPSISSMLGVIKNIIGLSDYLTSEEENIKNYITKIPESNLNILTAGSVSSNPDELLASEKMVYLINKLKNHNNNYIIIDSPPLMPVSDPVILSSLVDSIIIVVKAFSTQRKVVKEAIDKIDDKDKILGIVLNDCKNIFSRYSYSYYV